MFFLPRDPTKPKQYRLRPFYIGAYALLVLEAIAIVIWMAAELTANIWLAFLEKPYEIHISFILAALGLVLGGKVAQKGVEIFNKPKKDN